MFYEHLGFYGEDLKLARMEQFVESQGKTDEFRAESRWLSIFRKCDLPLPKKPDIHTPTLSVGTSRARS